MSPTLRIERLSELETEQYFSQIADSISSYSDSDYRSQRAHKLATQASFLTARNEQNELIGLIAYYSNRPPLCYITHLSVNSSYRRMRIASRMLNLLIEKITQAGFCEIQLEVHKDNFSAQELYLKHGFLPTQRTLDNNILLQRKIESNKVTNCHNP